LAAGSYSVIVTDANGCSTASLPVTITQPSAALSASATGESLICSGDADGNITLTVQGGTPTYTYSWKKTGDNVTVVSTAQNPSGLSAGTYNVLVTDSNGCTTTASATIVDGDGTDPVVTAPADYSLEGCDTSAIVGRVYSETLVDITSSYTGVGVVETGTGIASVKYSDSKSETTCPIVVTRTFTVTDNCGNIGTATQKISIVDTTAPVLTIPANAGIECTADITPGSLGMATATDNCDGDLTPTFTDGDCFGLENKKEVNAGQGIYQHFTISGMAGLGVNSIKDFTLTFETNQGIGRTEFILVSPNNGKGIVLVGTYCTGGNCEDNGTYSPTFSDNTGDPIWVNGISIGVGAGNFRPNGGPSPNLGSVNGLTSLVSSFEELTNGMTSLDGDWFVYAKKQVYENGNVRFISSCLTPALGESCAKNNIIIREWTVTDNCKNTSTGNQVIVISDTTAPVASGSITDTIIEGCTVEDAPDAVKTVAELEALTEGLSISDNCSDKADLKVSSSDEVSGTCPIVITRTYKVTDECANESLDIIHTIKINDTTDPTGTAPADIADLKDIANIPAADIEAVTDEADNCSAVTVTVNDTNNEGSGCSGDPYIVTRTYTLTDACGNDIDLVQTITVEADLVTVDAPEDVTECDSYMLLELINGAYFGATGGVNPIPVGTVITETTTIYVYAVSADNANCTAENSFLVTINALPVAPTGEDQTVCEESPIQTLTATATVPEGFSVVWYDAAIDGNVVESPTLSSFGSVTYYAESVNDATTCVSNSRTAITLTINPAPVAPTSGGDQTVCYNGLQTQTLTATATGGIITWYDAAIGGNVVTSPTQVGVGSVTYYAESSNETCSSLTRTAVTLTINPAPVAPTSGGNQTVCSNGSSTQTLTATATGGTISWFDAQIGGNMVISPTQVGVGTSTYYAQSSNGTCSSLTRTAVTLTINPAPVAPISGGDQTVCTDGSSTQTLTATATGGIITWYDAATGGNVVTSPTQVGVGTSTYYAQSGNETCSSLTRTAVTLTINEAPTAPISGGNQTVCSDGSLTQTLTATATGGIITWYTAATGGNVVTSPTQVGVGSVTYYAESSNETCSSLTRTAVTLTINPAPTAPTSGGNQTVCSDGSSTQTLTATATGGIITWYDAATGGNVVTSPTQVGVGSVTYYAQSSNETCSSLTRTAVTLTINAKPEVTISGNTVLNCINESTTLTATATVQGAASYLWSTGATTAAIEVTASGEYSVTVTDGSSGCSATATVTVTGDATPPTATISGNATLTCSTESITLTATATVQGTPSYLWNTGATTSTIEVTAPGDYSVVVLDSENGCTATATTTVSQNKTPPTVIISGNEALTCNVTSITLNAGGTVVQGTATYLWNTGATTASITVDQAGDYTVAVTDSNSGCSGALTITVEENYVASEITGGSTSLCIEDVNLDLTTLLTSGFASGGTWSDDLNSGGLTGNSFNPSVVNLGDYQFTYTEPGDCGRIITVTVNVNDDCVVLACSTPEDISKVVTPNGDGINDVFSVGDVSGGNPCKYIVKIFNRWGKIVYQSDNYQNNWNGKHDGSGMQIGSNSELPTGTYYYIVNIIVSDGSSTKPITGYIYLGTH
jgi:gliding motility-associated-like protein